MRALVAGGCAVALILAMGGTVSAQSRGGYYGPPPCSAVTPSPLRGAARGAAGGAVVGAIFGDAGRGAAIGAGMRGVGAMVRRGNARASGYCY